MGENSLNSLNFNCSKIKSEPIDDFDQSIIFSSSSIIKFEPLSATKVPNFDIAIKTEKIESESTSKFVNSTEFEVFNAIIKNNHHLTIPIPKNFKIIKREKLNANGCKTVDQKPKEKSLNIKENTKNVESVSSQNCLSMFESLEVFNVKQEPEEIIFDNNEGAEFLVSDDLDDEIPNKGSKVFKEEKNFDKAISNDVIKFEKSPSSHFKSIDQPFNTIKNLKVKKDPQKCQVVPANWVIVRKDQPIKFKSHPEVCRKLPETVNDSRVVLGQPRKVRLTQPNRLTDRLEIPIQNDVKVPVLVSNYREKETFNAPITTVEPSRSSNFLPTSAIQQCQKCWIIFKSPDQLYAHVRIHDPYKAKLAVEEMTKNVYEQVNMKVEMMSPKKILYVLLPHRDYAFRIVNYSATKKYMKCIVQGCECKCYATTDGKFFLRKGDVHSHIHCKNIIDFKVKEAAAQLRLVSEKNRKQNLIKYKSKKIKIEK